MQNTNTPTPTASLGAPQANTAPVVKHQVELDEVDLLICAPRRYFASPQEEYAYYVTKEQQEAFFGVPDFNTTHTAKVLDAWLVQYPSSMAQPVAAGVVVSTAPANAPAPVAVVSNTQPSAVPTASTHSPIVTLDDCNDWLQLTYADELAELAKLGAYVQARAVCALYEEISPSTAVLVTVKDGLVGGAAGPEGELTFTFLDWDGPKVELGGLTMPQFQAMARRCWQELAYIKDVYQTRAACIVANLASYVAAYMDVTRASPLLDLPDVQRQADPMPFNWFTGDTLPQFDEIQDQYPQPKQWALVEVYYRRAVEGV